MSTFYILPKGSDLMHYGVKGMKWGVRKEIKKQFKSDKRDLYWKYMQEEWKNQDTHGYKARLDAMDEAERKRHSGYEYGDLYDPDWQLGKQKNKKILEYSRLTDLVYGDGESYSMEDAVHDAATKRVADTLLKKYGGTTWKEVKKNYPG